MQIKNEQIAVKATTAVQEPKQNGTMPSSTMRAMLYNEWHKVAEQDRFKHIQNLCTVLNIPTPMNPFRFIEMKGRTVLYAGVEAAQLLARLNNLSITTTGKSLDADANLLTIDMKAVDGNGRTVENFGCIYLGGLVGQERGNAIMKCHTKTFRRTVFTAVGLSAADEDDLERESSYMGTPQNLIPQQPPKPVEEQSQVVPESQLSEDEEARMYILRELTKKGGICERDAKKAKQWIVSVGEVPFEKLTADNVQELVAIMQEEMAPLENVEPVLAVAIPLTEEESKHDIFK